jgi:hypothetical protein
MNRIITILIVIIIIIIIIIGQVLSKGEVDKQCKHGVGPFKSFILKNYEAKKAEFYMKDL